MAMSEKTLRNTNAGEQPIPMKLFATWEVEKSSPNCIARLCSLTLTKLKVLRPLDNELSSLLIAVKIQNSKRLLRSNEILVPSGGLLETDLDLSFSLQYPHFLKRDANWLHIMLQRRKKYKNRTLMGFKTLAVGQLNMSQVLQYSRDRELNLYSDVKEHTNPVAVVVLAGLSSQPVYHEMSGHRKLVSSDVERSPDIESDDDDVPRYYNDYSSNDEMSDSEPTMTEQNIRAWQRKHSGSKILPVAGQGNFKQKFRALLNRFKISEDVLTTLDSEADQLPNPQELDDLFDELEDSDSGPDMDTISIMSTPKPRLRPFFTGRGTTPETSDAQKSSAIDTFRHDEVSVKRSDSDLHPPLQSDIELEASDSQNASAAESSPKPKSPRARKKELSKDREKVESLSAKEFRSKAESTHPAVVIVEDEESVPRTGLLDQLSAVFGASDDHLPSSIFLVNTGEWQGQLLALRVQDRQFHPIATSSEADTKAAISFLVNRIQKFCNSNARTPAPVKVVVIGGDAYINSVLRPYVEQFSNKSPDWQNYLRFLVIPFGPSSIGRYIATIDSTYESLFLDCQWKESFDKPDSPKLDSQDIINRISKYVNGANTMHHIPIAEALIMYKGKGADDVSSQIFIPFLSEVRIGTLENMNTSVEYDDAAHNMYMSGSPPASTPVLEKTRDISTPPGSPSIGNTGMSPSTSSHAGMVLPSSPAEFMDLQVDYWVTSPHRSETVDKDRDKKDKKESTKCSLKTAFRALYANRLPPPGNTQPATFSLMVVTKEKKQKIMRIGKKGKELESRSQAIEGVSRMVCTSKSQNVKLRVLVDGVEWNGVKFFQLSSQWQTHVKHFPVAVFGSSDV